MKKSVNNRIQTFRRQTQLQKMKKAVTDDLIRYLTKMGIWDPEKLRLEIKEKYNTYEAFREDIK